MGRKILFRRYVAVNQIFRMDFCILSQNFFIRLRLKDFCSFFLNDNTYKQLSIYANSVFTKIAKISNPVGQKRVSFDLFKFSDHFSCDFLYAGKGDKVLPESVIRN